MKEEKERMLQKVTILETRIKTVHNDNATLKKRPVDKKGSNQRRTPMRLELKTQTKNELIVKE